jgi:hypothetical protein
MNTEAYEEGYKAYENYQHLSENPYDDQLSTFIAEYNDWREGYYQARAIDNGDA